ncbi:hypothetical protein BZB76_1193 [Actinomadura pelletieri DSM 43383]|uniref:Uncharacterized protein n=1 Tax=Actinomadura pelletieri DSM 43383 TaxID=1120940 RepID=A0A495R0S9_9ACTN|nr:hypothetical protein [Actinomadura pelletieri]RKS79716.1 hypothetical protein BZB76_1193 [Actinomadura pelletieri DSM 43383]
MSYGIAFVERKPGQSWEEAMDDLEERAAGPDILTRPPEWDLVVTRVRELLGDVSVTENPPTWEIVHMPTAIQARCISREWSLSVPYWSEGDAARSVAERLRAISEIVEAATGLQAYDTQVGSAVLSEEWAAEQTASVFDDMANFFRKRGFLRR